MRNLIAIVVLGLCFVSVGFGQNDTAKYIQTLESEFNFQVNVYRRSLGLDSMISEEDHKYMCVLNNKRMSEDKRVLDCSWNTNKEFREIAHEGFDDRYNSYIDCLVSLDSIPRPMRPYLYSEIVGYVEVKYKESGIELAKRIVKGFMNSKDHREALVEPLNITSSVSFKLFRNNKGILYCCVTSIIKQKDPNILK